jgi:hypothetical protein
MNDLRRLGGYIPILGICYVQRTPFAWILPGLLFNKPLPYVDACKWRLALPSLTDDVKKIKRYTGRHQFLGKPTPHSYLNVCCNTIRYQHSFRFIEGNTLYVKYTGYSYL